MEEATNPPADRLARVVSAVFANVATLASPMKREAFVTAFEDLEGITTALELAERLTLVDEDDRLLSGPWVIIEFDTPESSLASPVFRSISGFVGKGRTAGGAREFVIPNTAISDLRNVTIRIVR